MIGDVDPEDGYDAGDPLADRLTLLVTIVRAIRDELDADRQHRRRDDLLRVIDNLFVELAGARQQLEALRAELKAI